MSSHTCSCCILEHQRCSLTPRLYVCTWVLAADQVCVGAVPGRAGGVLVGAQPCTVLCL